ncbi:MAG: UvrD-helicase domain-containing protein [Bacilli bacterium]|nr:UvrD-helicase domain-containing protein [Bacilli bacterium]
MEKEETRESVIEAELAQRDVLREKPSNAFVEAGAGAGKTYSLVSRIFFQLTSGNPLSEPKEIVAITFTNKAAEELRTRIVGRLKEKEEDDELEAKLQARKVDLLRHIDEMRISTIHKFCEDILREYAIGAGVAPDFKILIDEDEEMRKKRVIRDFFRNFQKADWKKYIDATPRSVKQNVCECFEALTGNVNHLSRSDIYFGEPNQKDFPTAQKERAKMERECCGLIYRFYAQHEAEIKKIDEQAKRDVEGKFNDKGEPKEPTLFVKKDYRELFDKFSSYPNADEFQKALARIKIDNPFTKVKLKKAYKNDAEAIDGALNLLDTAVNVYKMALAKLYVEDAYRLYVEYLKVCDEDIDHVSNNDMIYKTLILLKGNSKTLAKVRESITHLYIDEYQDTDSVQYSIAQLIAKGRKDCLYLVGDPKQSIYRFRGAEPDVFFSTKDEFAKSPATHDIHSLCINFRSNNHILEWVNNRYASIRLVSNGAYFYQPMLTAKKNFIPASEQTPERLIGFYSFPSSKPEQIAKLILQVKQNGEVREAVKDENDEYHSVYRPIEYKDIMLLSEGHKTMPAYVNALNAAGIPCRIFGKSDFASVFVVRTFAFLFRILNTHDETDYAIAESVFQSIFPSAYKGQTVTESNSLTLRFLNDLKNATKGMSPYGKAIYLIDHLNLLFAEHTKDYPFTVNNAKAKLYQMAEETFASSFDNGAALTAKIDEYLIQGVERESSIEPDLNAVMVINLHKAKGLEKPIVIYVSTTKKDNNQPQSIMHKGIFYYDAFLKAMKESKDASVSGLAKEVLYEDDCEDARKEYVAVTRPGEAYIFCQDDDHKKGLFNNKGRVYDHMALPHIHLKPFDPEKAKKESKEGEDKDNVYTPAEHKPNLSKKGCVITTSPSSMENAESPTREALKKKAKAIPNNPRPQSNVVGTILHRALELRLRYALSPQEATSAAVNESQDDIEEGNKDAILAFVLTCVESFDAYFQQNGFDQWERYPEFTFSYYKGEENVLSNGSIDLLLCQKDRFLLIDFKSDEALYIPDDATFEKTLIEKYKPQMDAYHLVLKDLFGAGKTIEKRIVYFRRYDDKKKTVDVCDCLI